jgi:hypothetical protein
MSWKCPTCGLINYDGNRLCADETCKTPTVKNFIEEARKIDQSIQLRSDLFNAHTVPIIERIKFIQSDESIPNEKKQFKIAETLLEMFQHQRDIAFTKRAESLDAENKLRAIQTTLNEYANRLHQTERDVLKLENINYDPTTPKPVKPTSVNKVKESSNKYNRNEVNAAAQKYRLDATLIRITSVQRNVNADRAGQILIESGVKPQS